jgi:hypothetical protein
MGAQQIGRVSGKALVVLSFIALLAVLSGFTQPPQVDEGTGAHIFQLSIVALVPVIFLFLATADWRRPLRSVGRPLGIPAAVLVLAFGALYYLEHRIATQPSQIIGPSILFTRATELKIQSSNRESKSERAALSREIAMAIVVRGSPRVYRRFRAAGSEFRPSKFI